ncbi:hypothetical protein GGS21DRAFT_507792 [Xylaria nigripes]|nr:hypothetical protein GGS21DRAFT_507792 [Xylaria nigripes]
MSVLTVFLFCFFQALALAAPFANNWNCTTHFPQPPAPAGSHVVTSLADATSVKDAAQTSVEPDGMDAGLTLDSSGIVGAVVGSIFLILTIGLLTWCGRARRFPGVVRKKRNTSGGRH